MPFTGCKPTSAAAILPQLPAQDMTLNLINGFVLSSLLLLQLHHVFHKHPVNMHHNQLTQPNYQSHLLDAE